MLVCEDPDISSEVMKWCVTNFFCVCILLKDLFSLCCLMFALGDAALFKFSFRLRNII